MERTERWVRQPYSRAALRSIKRALLGRQRLTLANRPFLLAYETRGHREEDDGPFLTALAASSSCVLDVGANVGLTALTMAAALKPGGTVWAIEPSEALCLVIHENVALNHLTNRVRVVNALIAEATGHIVPFYWDFDSPLASVARSRTSAVILPKVTLTLDDLVCGVGARPDLVKIDVEGAEAGVLDGMRSVLKRHRPTVFIEVHDFEELSLTQNVARLLRPLASVGYRMVHATSRRVITDASLFASLDAKPGCRTFVLLLPDELPMPELDFKHRDDCAGVMFS
jgi:FkbM family methyltransferase